MVAQAITGQAALNQASVTRATGWLTHTSRIQVAAVSVEVTSAGERVVGRR